MRVELVADSLLDADTLMRIVIELLDKTDSRISFLSIRPTGCKKARGRMTSCKRATDAIVAHAP